MIDCKDCLYWLCLTQEPMGECHFFPPKKASLTDNGGWPTTRPTDFCGQAKRVFAEGGKCRAGHLLTPENTYYKRNGTERQCKTCDKIRRSSSA